MYLFRVFRQLYNCHMHVLQTIQVAFSYLWEQLCTFTRDFGAIRTALNKVEAYSKTCFETALNGIRTIISDEWNNAPCQVKKLIFLSIFKEVISQTDVM